MRKLFIPLLLTQLLLTPIFALAGLSPEELAFAQKCHDNVNAEKKQLSVETALDCVKRLTDDNGALLARLRKQSPEMDEAAVDILAFNNALIDLRNIVTKSEAGGMVAQLQRVLEDQECPLCSMDLGPRPEKFFGWLGKEAGPRLPVVKQTVRTWEVLGPIRTGALSSAEYNYDQERWNALPLVQRYRVLKAWAIKVTDGLTAIYGASGSKLKDKKPDPLLVAVLREDLIAVGAYAQVKELDELSAGAVKREGVEAPGEASAADKKEKELSAASHSVDGLKGRSESDQAAYLSGTFDHAGQNAGGVPSAGTAAPKPAPFVYKELSNDQIAALPGRLVTSDAKGNLKGPFADEMRGTKAGDEILAFFKDPKYDKTGANRLNFSFTKQPEHQFGGWSPSEKTTKLNSELVNRWMKNNQVTPEQLFEGDPSTNPHMQKLSQYLAPTFVHESTHQRQTAKAIAGGYDFEVRFGSKRAPYQMEMETEAFAMDNSFMAEHLQKRGPSYAANLDPFDKRNTELFLEKGVEGVRLSNHRTYSYLDSFEGSASKELAAASSMAKELRSLEEKQKATPRTMSKDELSRMKELKAEMDSRFKWYTSVHADSVAAEEKINGWRKEINEKLYPSAPLEAPAPPELL